MGRKAILPPSSAHASMTQGLGPPAVLLRATLDHRPTLVGSEARMYGTTLIVGHQCDLSTTPRTPIASALGSQRNSGSRLRSLAENSKSMWQWMSITPSIMSSYRVTVCSFRDRKLTAKSAKKEVRIFLAKTQRHKRNVGATGSRP